MSKIILVFIYFFLVCNFNLALAQIISGQVNHDDLNFRNRIIDYKTNKPLEGAKVSIPEINYETFTDENGCFKLNADISNKTVMFVEKDGYKVFSLTVDNNVFKTPLKLGIEQVSPFDMQISQGIIHLGDNMFSNNSANSSDFRISANGYYFSNIFKKPKFTSKQNVVVVIGTIIGLDTKKAKQFGQNKIAKVYSAPSEVFVNGNKIAKLELNGDNIEIIIPKNILKETNELVVRCGKNLFQTSYIDYDDIEIANLRIELREKHTFARH